MVDGLLVRATIFETGICVRASAVVGGLVAPCHGGVGFRRSAGYGTPTDLRTKEGRDVIVVRRRNLLRVWDKVGFGDYYKGRTVLCVDFYGGGLLIWSWVLCI